MTTRNEIEVLVKEHLEKIRSTVLRELLRKQVGDAPPPEEPIPEEPTPEQPTIGTRETLTNEDIRNAIDSAKQKILQEIEALIDILGGLSDEQKNEIKPHIDAFIGEVNSKLDALRGA